MFLFSIVQVITVIVNGFIISGAVDTDAKLMPERFLRVMLHKAHPLQFTVGVKQINVDAGEDGGIVCCGP